MTVDINNMTYGELKCIADMFNKNQMPASPCENANHPWQIGKIYLLRTVTMIVTGRLVAVYPQELVLEDAAWVADTGRYSDAIKSAEFNEVEPYPDGQVIVGRGSLIDAPQISKVQRIRK